MRQSAIFVQRSTALYGPLYDLMDTEAMTADFAYRASGGRAGRANAVTAATFKPMLASKTIKNGFVMTTLEYEKMNAQMTELRERCRTLVAAFDAEVRRWRRRARRIVAACRSLLHVDVPVVELLAGGIGRGPQVAEGHLLAVVGDVDL